MANSTISLTVSLVMIALFAVAIISFAIHFAEDTDAAIDITQDEEIVALASNADTDFSNTFKEEAEETYSSIQGTTIEPGSDVVSSAGSFTITWKNILSFSENVTKIGYEKIFGSAEEFDIFFTIFIATIAFMASLFIIKTWRGNP